MTGLQIAGRRIGPDHPCLVIAEAGVNHNGDPDMAHRLIDLAADGAADAVKFQTFDPDSLASADASTAPYQTGAGATSQRQMLESLVLPEATWRDLAAHSDQRGLIFLSTAFDVASADLLDALGVPAFKVPSGELDNLAFIADLANRGRPLLISTGMGTMEEVERAVAVGQRAPGIALLHCVSAYPAPVQSSNLRAIVTMRERFGVPVGWSDHTTGLVTAVAAVALGALVIEKHVTLSHELPGPDHRASLDGPQFEHYVAAVRQAEASVGDGRKRPTSVEEPNRVHVRRSFHATRNLEPGQRVEEDDVILLRPAVGLPPSPSIVGRRVRRHVSAGSAVREGDVEIEP